MISPSEFRSLVSGQRRGFGAALLRGVLRLAEFPYTAVVSWRNRRYTRDPSRVHHVAVPVISVGNLSLGGTGKTPMVEYLARWLGAQQQRVAIISRGYGAEQGAQNDEALELGQKLPDVPHVQNPDRVEAARVAIEKFHCQVILLDDGFQHRRLGRDLDIVLIDALEPFGFGHLFPRGTLREPLESLKRADVVALSRADLVSDRRREEIQNEVRRWAPAAVWLETTHAPQHLLCSSGDAAELQTLKGRRVAACCGIGNPEGFRRTLAGRGYQVVAFRPFADHYAFQPSDVEDLSRWAEALDIEAVLCTHKDLVKLNVRRIGGRPLWAVVVGLEIRRGQEELEAKLRCLLPKRPGC